MIDARDFCCPNRSLVINWGQIPIHWLFARRAGLVRRSPPLRGNVRYAFDPACRWSGRSLYGDWTISTPICLDPINLAPKHRFRAARPGDHFL